MKQKKQDKYGSLTIRFKEETQEGKVVTYFRENTKSKSNIVRRMIYYLYGYNYLKGKNEEEIQSFLLEGIKFFSGELETLKFYLSLQENPEFKTTKREIQDRTKSQEKSSLASLANSFKL